MRNIRLDICYDGTRYRGWQRQPGEVMSSTIQGRLEQTLSRILKEPIELFGSGRTDAGVHARGQVANFHCQNPMPTEKILENLRKHLPEDIGIYDCREAADRFHARYNAKDKTYAYRIWNSQQPCIFERRYMTIIPQKLDLEQMRRGAACLVGQHDFAAFCTNKHMKKSTIRKIYALEIIQQGEEIRIEVRGDGFMRNMVRIIVGTLVEVGLGKRKAEEVPALFRAERADAGLMAPAQGLCLMEVTY